MQKDIENWYASWFKTPFYHILYKDRNDQEARFFMDGLTSFLNLPSGSEILDLACGKGRHARYLNELGFDVTGVDLSPESIAYETDVENFPQINDEPLLPDPKPTAVEINGKMVLVDRVIEGALCNDKWSGTVYVACSLQVLAWEEEPLFLKDCQLDIESGTVVYVASHNDSPYYKGCSCHTGEQVIE